MTRRNFHLTSPAARLDFRTEWLPRGVHNIEAAVTTFVYHRATDLRLERATVSMGPAVALQDGTGLTLSAEPSWQTLDGRSGGSPASRATRAGTATSGGSQGLRRAPARLRGPLALNPRVRFSVLQQWNSARETAAWNARLSWEFRPLCYVYLTFKDRRAMDLLASPGAPRRKDRELVAKVT